MIILTRPPYLKGEKVGGIKKKMVSAHRQAKIDYRRKGDSKKPKDLDEDLEKKKAIEDKIKKLKEELK